MTAKQSISPPKNKLGVLIPGMGAVGTTFIAGCLLARKGIAPAYGSIAEWGTVVAPNRESDSHVKIRDVVSLQSLDQLVFGGWDLFADNAYEAAVTADVLSRAHLDAIKDELSAIKPMSSVFFPEFVKRLRGENIKKSKSKAELAELVREDIRNFKKNNGLDRCVAVWCGSTESHAEASSVHATLAAFEQGLQKSDTAISPSQVYAYACLQEGVAYANGAPNLTLDVPALIELARQRGIPIAGKDLKTGQTLMKTVLAPGLRDKALGVRGWFSTNILGNRDGEVLDEPENFKSKEVSKMGVLESILDANQSPELYKELFHKIRIEYYPPRGDRKESWDNIDIFGWLGYPMEIKVNFLCRDSILAAPVVLDLVLFLDLAQRAGMSGVQEWLSFFFKSPQVASGEAEHDLFRQRSVLDRTLLKLGGQL